MLRQNYGVKMVESAPFFPPFLRRIINAATTSTYCKYYSHQLCSGGAKVVRFARFLRHIFK
jgi:hypothetical protein